MNRPSAGRSDEDLLFSYTHGEADARRVLPVRMQRRLLARARAFAPDLAARGLVEEALQQMWTLLETKTPGWYDPERSTALTWLTYLLRTAIGDVRAQNPPLPRGLPAQTEAVTLDFTVTTADGETASLAESVASGEMLEAQVLSDAEAVRVIDLAHQIDALNAGPALRMYAIEDQSFAEISAELSIDRFTLRRRLDSFAAHVTDLALVA